MRQLALIAVTSILGAHAALSQQLSKDLASAKAVAGAECRTSRTAIQKLDCYDTYERPVWGQEALSIYALYSHFYADSHTIWGRYDKGTISFGDATAAIKTLEAALLAQVSLRQQDKHDASTTTGYGAPLAKSSHVAPVAPPAAPSHGSASDPLKDAATAGEAYDRGDYATAAKLFVVLATQGYPVGQLKLADCYYRGLGVERNYTTAAYWYRKAADQGHPVAQNMMSRLYFNGVGVPKNLAMAADWERKSAEQGFPVSQMSLGWMYKTGTGGGADLTQALYWFRKSADQGYADAQFHVGLMYQTGSGMAQNYAEAMKWYRKAAEQGIGVVQYNIAILYLNGLGVPKDYRQSLTWLNLAAAQGFEPAKHLLSTLSAN